MATKSYRIHPGIGVARLGNSFSGYFIGPESPGVIPDAPYRDSRGFVKRQGARFRIFEYSHDDFGRLIDVKEITGEIAKIKWTVHMANTKASARSFPPSNGSRRNPLTPPDELNIDAGSQDVTGLNRKRVLAGHFKGTRVVLGNLLTDESGRLVVLGGRGISKSVPKGALLNHFANNPNWCDDVSDGPVRATVQFDGKEPIACDSAWLIVAPPSYAPAINNVVTLWDQALNVATRLNPSLRALLSPVSFARDIYPILKRTVLLQWVSESANTGHGIGTPGDFLDSSILSKLSSNKAESKDPRHDVYKRLRRPDAPADANMPRLRGGLDPDNPTSENVPTQLTALQLELMEEWQAGNFVSDWPGAPPAGQRLADISKSEQPQAMDKAALDACIGGPFFPGIEAGFVMARSDTYRVPFRIDDSKFAPGDITAGLACPWQADFRGCSVLWWPAQRPNWVIRNGERVHWTPSHWDYGDMVAEWSTLRFVVPEGEKYVEEAT